MCDDDPTLLEFYRSARSAEDPTATDRRVVRDGVISAVSSAVALHGGTAAAAAVAAAPTAPKLTLGGLAIWLGLGMSVGAAGIVAGESVQSRLQSAPSQAPAARSSQTLRLEATSANQAARELHGEPLTFPVRAPSPASPAPPLRRRSEPPSEAPTERADAAPASLLLAESQGLADVQRSLASGDAQQALRLLARQQKAFARGALREERAAARVLALCAAGRFEAARSARASFENTYPSSPLSTRVSNSCAREDSLTDSGVSGHGWLEK